MKEVIFVLSFGVMMLTAFAAPYVTNVVAKQRYPWNGKVDIYFDIVGNMQQYVANEPEKGLSLQVQAKDISKEKTFEAKEYAISGDINAKEGRHHIVWDFEMQDIEMFSTNVVFTVFFKKQFWRYCVIDLTSGNTAASYPVSYCMDIPVGGWTDEYKTTKIVLRLIESGSFKMKEQHDVSLSKPFYIGVFEITQKQYELVTGNKPSIYDGESRPVEMVSWNMIRGNSDYYNWPNVKIVDPNSFIGLIRSKSGLSLDIPTEAQWEYACRAGTRSNFNNGGNTDADLKILGRYIGNQNDGRGGYSEHTIVGSYVPNAWGLYDMHGNVWEWCLDWKGELVSGTDPEGPSSGTTRVMCGGGWDYEDFWCTSASRYEGYNHSPSSVSRFGFGFRIVRTLSE